MLLSLGTQLKLKYTGYLAGEKTCKTGEKVLRKAYATKAPISAQKALLSARNAR